MSQLTENKDKLLLTDCYDLFVRRFIEQRYNIDYFNDGFYPLVIGNFTYRKTKEGKEFWRDRFSKASNGKYYGEEWFNIYSTESLTPHLSNKIIWKYINTIKS